MKIMKQLLMMCLIINITPVSAMAISSLMLANADDQAGILTLDNTDNITYFLKTSVSKVEIKNNQIIKTPYTRKNLDRWQIATKPSKLVIEPNMVKDIQIESICGNKCDRTVDQVFQIHIQPVSYSNEGEEQSNISMLFGFAPYYIIPAKESKVEYQASYDGKNITAKNSGNTMLTLLIDQCKNNVQEESNKKPALCKTTFTLLAGRTRILHLPKELQRDNLDVIMLNHDETFKEEITLTQGE
ncbi:hypothetical protein [Psychromonas sp. Urea-02u-13]|uniref:hypothetical protein n=1 Tax=Psychromonas sp. Urea-02u-13 TaxID=2058326 RepID=UPI0018E3058B|nr:hypothetical protein [Psychromonas sp. Urea-02u-13]